MKKVTGGQMINASVQLDNTLYTGVKFINCTMKYSGLPGDLGLEGCELVNCSWEFDGAAGNTLAFLRSLVDGLGEPGKDLVKKIMDDILKD